MTTLNVAPMMTALRTTPEDFTLKNGWLRHTPSHHSFCFDDEGRVQIRADCGCASLSVREDQRPELYACFREWETSYWRPLEINKEFASHFRPRSRLRRMLIAVAARLHGWAIREDRQGGRAEAIAPAE